MPDHQMFRGKEATVKKEMQILACLYALQNEGHLLLEATKTYEALFLPRESASYSCAMLISKFQARFQRRDNSVQSRADWSGPGGDCEKDPCLLSQVGSLSLEACFYCFSAIN